jgi:mannobiose 2-epimerase
VPQTDRNIICTEMQQVLDKELNRWYPLCIDTACGGYYSDINFRWELEGPQDKMIVTQARHVWSTANAALFYQKDNVLRTMGAHGVEFLRDKMWDHEYGGFYDLVSREGEPRPEGGQIIKRAYGNAFAIYGLAAYYGASGDTAALRLAKEAFAWLEKHSHDPVHGGYFQFMSRDGTPLTSGYGNTPPKDQNSTIHLLEAFSELYRVWPDPLLKERLQSLLRIVRDTITTEKGYMMLFFLRDWTPVSYQDASPADRERNYEFDHVSFGHDVEVAYLMLEASEALGIKDDTTTLQKAKRMVDHVLRNGWDEQRGGIFDGGYYFPGQEKPAIVRRTKEWWAQVEAFNSFLMMSELFPSDTMRYYDRFCDQWEYCKKYVIDNEHGGWYWGGADIVPGITRSAKGSIWKADYHTSRGLITCIRRLKRETMTQGPPSYEPVNQNATAEARTLLKFLYSLKGNRIISGHHNSAATPDKFPNRVKEVTGKTPEVWGCDFGSYYKKGEGERIVREAYQKYREGYIITLMWHAGRPQDDPPFGWKESIQAKLTDHEWKELTTPGTRLNARWLEQVDIVAEYLKDLQNLGVPVLWRPYHEANGVWFWWGNRKGEYGAAKLYRMMYDRYVHHHNLNNLLWVWNTNAPRQLINDEAYAYEDFFPGLDYIDVLATDIYHRDYQQSHHDELAILGKGKLIALGEVGEVPNPEILERQPLWSWFMVWADFVDTHNTPEQMKALYSTPRVLTHEEFLTIR